MDEGRLAIDQLHCATWDEFIQKSRLGDGRPLSPLYRGHGDPTWTLIAPVFRRLKQQTDAMRARGLGVAPGWQDRPANWASGQIEAFKNYCLSIPGCDISSLSDLELKALARHNGLQSDLLDWTESRFIAAFFAFVGAVDGANGNRLSSGTLQDGPMYTPQDSVVVWELSVSSEMIDDPNIEIVSAKSHINHWQKAQRGHFTQLINRDFFALDEYLTSIGMDGQLTRFSIAGNQAFRALSELEDMNINFASLSPDFRGAANQANLGLALKLAGAS